MDSRGTKVFKPAHMEAVSPFTVIKQYKRQLFLIAK